MTSVGQRQEEVGNAGELVCPPAGKEARKNIGEGQGWNKVTHVDTRKTWNTRTSAHSVNLATAFTVHNSIFYTGDYDSSDDLPATHSPR